MTHPFFDRVGIVGGGLMGSGIAARLAASGQPVVVCEPVPVQASQVAARCAAVFEEQRAGGVLTPQEAVDAAARVHVVTGVDDLAGVPFVVEAATESLAVKHPVYTALEAVLPDDAVLASSTSGFTPARLGEPLARPERFLVAHFWNPPHLVPLVEVVAGPATAPAVVDLTMRALAAFGCTPVLLTKAVPGFVGNRLQFALLREALNLLAEGVADARTIDFVVKQSIGRRYALIGPLEGADIGGLQTFQAIARYLMPDLGADTQALELLARHVDGGRLGRASGAGFHAWDASREAWLRTVRLELMRRAANDPAEPS